MPRRRLVRTNLYPYHITARVHRKAPYPIPIDEVWKILLRRLAQVQKTDDFTLYVVVLMPNHLHMLVQTPNSDLDNIMYKLMKGISLSVLAKARLINSLWGSRYNWNLITTNQYYYNVYKYVLRNPLKAGLANDYRKYPYILGSFNNLFEQIKTEEFLNMDRITHDQWINQEFNPRHDEIIKRGFRKRRFEYPKTTPEHDLPGLLA
jgi:putative transposase